MSLPLLQSQLREDVDWARGSMRQQTSTGDYMLRWRKDHHFCLRSGNRARDMNTYTACTVCKTKYIHYTEGNICSPVQLTPVDLQRTKVKTSL